MINREDYIEYLKSLSLSSSTIKKYLYYFKYIPKNNIDKIKISRYLNRCQNKSTARAVLKHWSDINELNLHIPLIRGRKRSRLIKVLSDNERLLLRAEIYKKRIRYGILYDLLYYGGLRISEALGVKYKDFNFTEKPCPLRVIGKGDKERIVFIPIEVVNNIIRYGTAKGVLKEDKVLNFTRYSFNKVIRKISLEILDRNAYPHLLRHTIASKWLNKGTDIYVIRDFLGHSSVLTTEKYLHSDLEKAYKVMRKNVVFD